MTLGVIEERGVAISITLVSLAWVLISEATAAIDPISGGAGWVGAGLLGALLGWLLFVHLPSKDKQMKELIEGKDKMVADIVDGYEKRLEAMSVIYRQESRESRDDFKKALDAVMQHCEKEAGRTSDAVRAEIRSLSIGASGSSPLPKAPQ